jgi:O-antigen/teichoic acid export membrane protein
MSTGEDETQGIQDQVEAELDAERSASRMLDAKRVARGAGISLLGQILMQVGATVTTWVFAHYLGAAVYGQYSIALAVIRVAAVTAILGIDVGSVRFVAVHRGEGDQSRVKGSIVSAFGLAGGIGFVFGAALFVAADWIAGRFFHKPEVGPLLRVFAIVVPLMALEQVISGVLRGLKNIKQLVIVDNVIFVWLVWMVGFALIKVFHVRAVSAPFGHVAAGAVAVSIGIAMIGRRVRLLDRRVRPAYNPKKLLRYSVPLYPNSITVVFQHWLDTLFLGKLIPRVADVGIYRVAARTGFLGRSQVQALSTIFAPMVADHYHQGRLERIARLYETTTRWSIMTGLPLYVFLSLFPGIVLSFFGKAYGGGGMVLQVIIIGHIGHIATGSSGQILAMTGHQRMNMYISVGALALTVALLFMLVPGMQLMGAAWATTAAVIFTNLCFLVAIWVLFRMQPYNKATLRPVAASLAAGALVWWLFRVMFPVTRFVGLAVPFVVFCLAYAVVLRLLGFEPEDGEVWRQIKQKLGFGRSQPGEA